MLNSLKNYKNMLVIKINYFMNIFKKVYTYERVIIFVISIILFVFGGIKIYDLLESRDISKRTFKALITEGDELTETYDFDGALNKYESARIIYPNKEEVILKIIKARILKVNYLIDKCAKTEEEMEQIKNINAESHLIKISKSNKSEAFWLLGIYYELMKDFVSAEKNYDQAIKNAQTPKFYNSRGVYFLNVKNYEKALKDFDTAIKLDYGYFKAHHNKGLVFLEIKKYEEAYLNFFKALEINPKDDFSYNGIGRILLIRKEYTDSIKSFKRAININPKIFWYYYNRGMAYYYTEEYILAITDFDKAIKINPYNYCLYKWRALAHYKNRHFSKAIEDINQAISLAKNCEDCLREFKKDKEKIQNNYQKEKDAKILEGK